MCFTSKDSSLTMQDLLWMQEIVPILFIQHNTKQGPQSKGEVFNC